MREWQKLLEHIDSYLYSDEEEEIIIKHNSNAAKAVEVYEKALSVLDTSDDEAKPGIRRRRGNIHRKNTGTLLLRQMVFPVALWCIYLQFYIHCTTLEIVLLQTIIEI